MEVEKDELVSLLYVVVCRSAHQLHYNVGNCVFFAARSPAEYPVLNLGTEGTLKRQ